MTRYLAGILATALIGCAGVTVRPLPNDPDAERKLCDKGVRYFQEAPFLLVYSDGKGGLISELVFLPDTTQRMSARPYALFASNDATLNFSNGVLTGMQEKVDETIVPVAVLKSVEAVASSAIKAAFNTAGESAATLLPAPYLFKIVVHGPDAMLLGPARLPNGQPLPPIHVTISQPAKDDKK